MDDLHQNHHDSCSDGPPPTTSVAMVKFPTSQDQDPAIEKIACAVKQILEALGEDVGREGLEKTPERVARAMLFLTGGYNLDSTAILQKAIFNEDPNSFVLVKDISFSSLCEHHLVPFVGKAHVGYIPNGKIVGLSKIARVVEGFARRLQVQERLTTQVAQSLFDVLQPHGVAVVMEAVHFCMVMRGVEKTSASTTTTAFVGGFEGHGHTKEDFWRALGR
ncbi:GTP cyclohydrolase I, putative [Cordyceps militaris CM01]|uniref:GTP cyclohydrolase 1 n=1 Tax=Cordyceps militaris (strain CM01) TaxID=983644 RepID=G3JCB6_CORMM|nr:GTP cyclohydrolase I, putative [Cordyceps militaris CM01]EGX93781.1 GTP cyclohydrolase I, putative [Cordyceps militaris CM01]